MFDIKVLHYEDVEHVKARRDVFNRNIFFSNQKVKLIYIKFRSQIKTSTKFSDNAVKNF